MGDDEKYRVDTARDDVSNLVEVLQFVATLPGHVRIVGITWQPTRTSKDGSVLRAGYTIITETEG